MRAIGHGIDVNEFDVRRRSGAHDGVRALVLGRYSPAKGIETILRGGRSRSTDVEVELHGAALNELEQRHRGELERLGIPLGDAVPRAQVPELFARVGRPRQQHAGRRARQGRLRGSCRVPAGARLESRLRRAVRGLSARRSSASRPRASRSGCAGSRASTTRSAPRSAARCASASQRSHSVDTWADGILAAAS